MIYAFHKQLIFFQNFLHKMLEFLKSSGEKNSSQISNRNLTHENHEVICVNYLPVDAFREFYPGTNLLLLQ